MKTLLLAGITAVTLSAAAAFTPAAAQGGCGPYAHRGYDGFCHPNVRPRPYGFYGYGYHRPWGYGGYGYGYHRPWGYGGWRRW